MRNQAEKLRRDKLNTYISQLALIVPTVGLANKRLDKISILRLAANFLRIHLGESQWGRKKKRNFGEANHDSTFLSGIESSIFRGFHEHTPAESPSGNVSVLNHKRENIRSCRLRSRH